jgi:tetratricopeptide (TPR) repeat protein
VLENSPKAWPWLERALTLAPDWGSTHIWAAEWLLQQRHQERALDQLSKAAALDPQQALPTLCSWLSRAPYAQVALRVAPEAGPRRTHILDGSAACLPTAEAAKIDELLLRTEPRHYAANIRTLKRRLARGDAAEVASAAHALQAVHPSEVEPYYLEAQALQARGQPSGAVAALRKGLGQVRDRPFLLTLLALAYARARDGAGLRDTVEQLHYLSAGDPRRVAHALVTLAQGESELGNDARSLKAAREAYDLVPDPHTLAHSARAAERLGHYDFALRSWERVCHELPNHPDYCKLHASLRDRLTAPPGGRLP